ncbi:hypothetical protein niasHS_013687 [Heterodera schachtii]|uniref:Uncharacterized protein n=1 Tax=Heterodera schachtii TaxID=97005 RepID=A0ABD2IFX2_HETSC
MHWKIIVALACSFGIIKKFRPGTPFLTPFLESEEFKNFTNAQVNSEIYTYWTYSNLFAMVPIIVVTDFLRYKPILVLEAVSLLACWLLLVYGTTLRQMQLMQICFGISTAASVAYNTYLYAIVDKRHYKKVTSYFRTASMVGKFLAYCSGQILITTKIGDFLLLNEITLIVSSLLIPIVIVLPMPKKEKEQIDKKSPAEQQQQNEFLLESDPHKNADQPKSDGIDGTVVLTDQMNANKVSDQLEIDRPKSDQQKPSHWAKIKTKFFAAYQNRVVFHWSIFSIIITAIVYQAQNYIQTLWAYRKVHEKYVWNGFVESINTLLSALVVFLVQFIPLKWAEHSILVCCISTMVMALLLYAMVYFGSIFADYILYIVLYMFYNMLITISSDLIATHLSPNGAYGLVFGINGFVGVLLQALITLIIVDANGPFALSIEAQFITYSLIFVASSLLLPILQLLVKCGKK